MREIVHFFSELQRTFFKTNPFPNEIPRFSPEMLKLLTKTHRRRRKTRVLSPETHRHGSKTRVLSNETHRRGSKTRVLSAETRRRGSKTRALSNETHRRGSKTRALSNETRRRGSKTRVLLEETPRGACIWHGSGGEARCLPHNRVSRLEELLWGLDGSHSLGF